PALRGAHTVAGVDASRRQAHLRRVRRYALVGRLPHGCEPAVSLSGAEALRTGPMLHRDARPVQARASPRLRALLLCAILLGAAPAGADGTPESSPPQNLDYQAGLE